VIKSNDMSGIIYGMLLRLQIQKDVQPWLLTWHGVLPAMPFLMPPKCWKSMKITLKVKDSHQNLFTF